MKAELRAAVQIGAGGQRARAGDGAGGAVERGEEAVRRVRQPASSKRGDLALDVIEKAVV